MMADNLSAHVMSLDNSGNMILAGNLTVDGSIADNGGTVINCSTCPAPLTVIHRSAAGTKVGAYTAEQTIRTLEDVGEAQLVNGAAYVRLDPAFVSVIDRRSNYLVFITPQGQSRGWLYVAQKTGYGFAVRETQGGRSTLAFDYRIVAKPLGSAGTRLPLITRGLLGPEPFARPFLPRRAGRERHR